MRGIQKRKFAEVGDNSSSSSSSSSSSPVSSEWESDGESSASDNQDLPPRSSPLTSPTMPVRSILKRPRLGSTQSRVRFDRVTVFGFPRCQGFVSVPRRGGASLGMVQRHSGVQSYTVAEHALDRQHRRRERLRERRREDRLKTLKHKLIISGAMDQQEAEQLTVDQMPDEDGDALISEAELPDRGFLLPYSSKQRQALLQAAGVKRIDREEKRQLHALRVSREACGCDCRGFCEPETCACSQAGIKCQVDRFNFPCGCTKDSCGNTNGRTEFDSRRAQTHYIHTVMRLELERRLQDDALSHRDRRTELPEDLVVECEGRVGATPASESGQGTVCPFGVTMEEDGLSLTVPAMPSFHFSPEPALVEENSCSSDMTESSRSSSDCDTAGCLAASLPEGLPNSLHMSDSDNNNYLRHSREMQMQQSTATDSAGPFVADGVNRTLLTDCVDENANQVRGVFDTDSLESYPNTPSPTVDFSSVSYMDLSLSSDSDLELFESDYPSPLLHSSFKAPRRPDGVCHLQLFRLENLPQYESSTYLLESLIGPD